MPRTSPRRSALRAAWCASALLAGCTVPSTYILDDAGADVATPVDRPDGTGAAIDASADVPLDVAPDATSDVPTVDAPSIDTPSIDTPSTDVTPVDAPPADTPRDVPPTDAADAGADVPGNVDARDLCPPGRTSCNEACFDLATDPLHCGECNNACAGNCTGGGCVVVGVEECPRGQSHCPGGCANTETDPDNCGECSNRCESRRCSRGGCL